MQTHKNPDLRKGGAVSISSPKPYPGRSNAPKSKAPAAAPAKEPVCELDGKRWKVNN